MKLSKEEQGILLLSARSSIKTLFEDIKLPGVDYKQFPGLSIKAGAFVTLHKYDDLRGCIGYITSELPLFETVCQAAILAASEDPRFPPVTLDEVPKLLIEISVLSPPKHISSYEEIIIGEHGLIIEEKYTRGLLLPQVATENNFNRDAFLTVVCRKAGLPPYEWKERLINLYTFTAAVFSEGLHRNLTSEKI